MFSRQVRKMERKVGDFLFKIFSLVVFFGVLYGLGSCFKKDDKKDTQQHLAVSSVVQNKVHNTQLAQSTQITETREQAELRRAKEFAEIQAAVDEINKKYKKEATIRNREQSKRILGKTKEQKAQIPNDDYGVQKITIRDSFSSTPQSSYSYSGSSSRYSGTKEIHVKSYTRKDGTFVESHTRSRPNR